MSNKHHERQEPKAASEPDRGLEAAAPAEAKAPPEPRTEAPGPDKAETEALRSRIKDLEARLTLLAEENSSTKNQYLRSLAEYENFRKRMFREREDLQKYSNFGLLGDLVPLLDDFDRAIASSEHGKDFQTLHDGILIIRRQIGSVLENKYGLARYESLGKPFDPNVHEAVASEPGEVEEPLVSLEFLPGYRLHDRVVRSAKVRVKMPAPKSASTQGADPAAGRGDLAGAGAGAGVDGEKKASDGDAAAAME